MWILIYLLLNLELVSVKYSPSCLQVKAPLLLLTSAQWKKMEIHSFIQWALRARLCAMDWLTKVNKTQFPVWNNIEKPGKKNGNNKNNLEAQIASKTLFLHVVVKESPEAISIWISRPSREDY